MICYDRDHANAGSIFKAGEEEKVWTDFSTMNCFYFRSKK